ncbi:MAG: DUF4154 domain-containing protein [Bacteroidales bacterium]|nr:DUF4154 domain-containing protein [Bacteroidales bacterium]
MIIKCKILVTIILTSKAFLLAVILQLLNPTELFAQLSDSKIKTVYAYQFVQNIEWPDEQAIDSFSIVVFANNPALIQDFKEISRTKTLKSKPISIKVINDISQIIKPFPKVIYVEKNFNQNLIKLLRIIENSPVLVITEEYDIKDLVMINLFYVDKNARLEFEVNKNSIEAQHSLRILPKLLLLGGSKVDVALLYKKQEELLENAYEKVKKFQLEIDSQQKLIDFQHKEIDEQKKAIEVQKIEIENQQFRINSQKNSLDTLINEVENQRQMISVNLIILKEHQKEIEQQQKQKIIENEEMVKRNEVLGKQKIEIQNQQQKIDSQGNILDLQQKRIQTQKWFLFLSFAVVFLTFFLIYFIYRGYKSKQNANKLLEESNISIQHKNEEIEAYNEELKVTNDELNFQKEEIFAQKEEILAQKDKLQLANATKDKFFGIIAHDLRNPFNLLLGLSEILVDQINASNHDKSIEISEKINQTSSVAFDLLENLLTWSRSQTGQTLFYPSNLNVKDAIDTNILLLKSSAESKGIHLSSVLTDNLYVRADKNMLLTILRNLLTNAIKFSRNSDKIFVKAEENDDCITIHVSDTGVGLDKHVIEKLFKVNENVKTDGTANERGTGLGLILCKEFIDWHQGKIWVESKKGIGSRFSFTLPKVKE